MLLGVFSRSHGRIGLLAKGARRLKSPMRGVLRPFQPLAMNWSGRSELASLYNVEAAGVYPELRREALVCAYYMNELLLKFLHKHDPHEKLFDRYAEILLLLGDERSREPALRRFEKYLLEEVGYGLVLEREAAGRTPVVAGEWYRYDPERGPLVDDGGGDRGGRHGIRVRGETLLALHREQLDGPRERDESKRLLRAVLHHYLGGRALNSRNFALGLGAERRRAPGG